jgi:hypothetical protein
VTALPQLRVLELSDCRNISVEALRSIGAVADTLESLSLMNCVQLDSEALLQLARFKKLKRLSLAGCRGAADVIALSPPAVSCVAYAVLVLYVCFAYALLMLHLGCTYVLYR